MSRAEPRYSSMQEMEHRHGIVASRRRERELERRGSHLVHLRYHPHRTIVYSIERSGGLRLGRHQSSAGTDRRSHGARPRRIVPKDNVPDFTLINEGTDSCSSYRQTAARLSSDTAALSRPYRYFEENARHPSALSIDLRASQLGSSFSSSNCHPALSSNPRTAQPRKGWRAASGGKYRGQCRA